VIDGETPYLAQASACATILLVPMNMTLNTLGLYQAGKGKLTPRDAISVIFHMPVIYTLVAVFTIKFSGFDMTQVFLWPIFENCANA
ncbi:MAG TPA: permease, partial [Dialister sp.]|nr:permease [Dialister sp.]